uniref:olfactory receptor 1571-like n=1 Tax=Monopterus albus TaxID=43700 RepID=UPI0009B4BE0C|nr:olfactory receptor 1571-like [Monopterus albus]
MDHEESNSQSVEIVEEMVHSLLHPSTDLETIREEDQLDGSMLKLFSDIVRCFVTRILHTAIREHNEYLCNGCKISHGSQKQHTCLFGIPNNFLRKHYDDLEKRVLTEQFLVAASQLLEKYNIRVSEEKIRHAAESTLLGLRGCKNLEKTSDHTVANWLDIFLFDHPYIPYNDCLTFLFFCYACLSMQPLNLVALAYDRMIAIIFPLHYRVKVTHRFMFSLIVSFWLFAITVTIIAVTLLTRLSYCKSVVINSYFCDYGQIYRLACNDNISGLVISVLLPVLLLWLPLVFILFTYLYICFSLTKVATVHERVKAFKTCTAHLSLVTIYFLPVMITFTSLGNLHPNARIINPSLTSVFPPTLNPIIYVLQTKEIKESVKKLFKIRVQSKKITQTISNKCVC